MSEREHETTHSEGDESEAARSDEPMAQDSAAVENGGETTSEASAEGSAPRATATASSDGGAEERAPLLAQNEAERFRRRWKDLQVGFVDHPQEMVEEADDLVGELMQQLSAGFDSERSSLEAQWEKGEEVSTEELRVALTRYRSFFNRLLSA